MIRSILFTLSLLFLIQGCSDNSQEVAVEKANAVIASNDYELHDLNGTTLSITKSANNFILKGAEGKLVIYDIFATWCPPCRAIAPHLAELQKEFSNDLLVIGITIEEDKTNADLLAYQKEHNADYTLVNSKQNRTFANALASAVDAGSGFAIPLLVMYKDGKYITHYAGAVPPEMIRADIKKILDK
jgi:thiol-disulfide isomerase/thioredoxin